MAEVTRVRVELQEQNGRLQAELTAQEALREKVAALERQLKGELNPEPLHATSAAPWWVIRQAAGLQLSLGLNSQRRWHGELSVSASSGSRASSAWLLGGHLQWPVPNAQTAPSGSLCSSSPAVIASDHREALLDRESENASLREKLRLKEAEMARIRDEEAQRASFLQNAVLAYVQGSPLRALSPQK